MDVITTQGLFQLKPVTDSVYIALAALPPSWAGPLGLQNYYVNCNAAVIILDDGVLIADSQARPSVARALMRQIRQLADKPIKYLVNTHAHWDHIRGNQAYLSAWPSLEIISSRPAGESMELSAVSRLKDDLGVVPGDIARLKSEIAATPDTAQRQILSEALPHCEEYLAELQKMQIVLPTITFEQRLVIHRPSCSVEILYLGRGHSAGDVVVYVPQEGVIVTGDLIYGFVPWMGDSYPHDWIRTLEAMEKLDFEYIIGGHGDVVRGKQILDALKHYFQDLLAFTAEASADGAPLSQVQERIVPRLQAKHAIVFRALDLPGHVEKAYRVITDKIG